MPFWWSRTSLSSPVVIYAEFLCYNSFFFFFFFFCCSRLLLLLQLCHCVLIAIVCSSSLLLSVPQEAVLYVSWLWQLPGNFMSSRASVARTPMARLPWLIPIRFGVPMIFFDSSRKQIFRCIILCVLIRIEKIALNYRKLSPFGSWPGAMINPQWLELPISRTNFHGP